MSDTQQKCPTDEKLRFKLAKDTIPEDIDLLHSYCDADLVRYIHQSPVVPHHNSMFILSANLIAKGYRPELLQDAIVAMEAATKLGIRVPAAKRTVTFGRDTYLIMERIAGVTLEEAWPTLGWLASIRIALQLRRFVHLLRSSTSLTAGSLVSGECRSFYLEDHFMLPPKSSPAVITSFIGFWTSFTSIRQAMTSATQDPVPPTTYIPTTPNTLVFTHHDLAPRNLLLDPLGKLWVLDWDDAGWYPRYFEYAAMQNFPARHFWNRLARARWFLFTWITVGRFEQERKVLEAIKRKFTRFPVGRRFAILANRSPAGRPCS